MLDYDVVVVGAGVVGLACAERLSRDGARTLVLERHQSYGCETSSRSSEVVHSGVYYPSGSLKATLCVAGNRSIETWCARHDVGFARTGKLIVATREDEVPQLEAIRARGEANGVPGLAMLSAREVGAREPRVVACAALSCPSSGIVDSHALVTSLGAAARRSGCDFALRHTLRSVEPLAGGYRLDVEGAGTRTTTRARAVVNAAGLASDEVAAMAGIDVDAAGYRLQYVKGRYVRVRQRGLVRALVYPVPLPGLAGLGVHATIDLAGSIRLGPDVVPLRDRAIDLHVGEDVVAPFLEAASRYLPGLTRDDLSPDQAGIRPKLSAPPGVVADFVIAEESTRGLPGWVNLVGIESPGLTCSLEIAERVRGLLA